MGTAAAEPNGGTNPGSPGAADGGQGGGAGTGTQGDGIGGQGGTLDRSRLSPVLRNLDEGQINELMDTMVATLASRRQPAPAPAPAPAPQPEPDYREMFDPASDKYDPRAAVADITQRNYGGVVRDIAQNATEGLYLQMRQQFPDFHEVEQDVRTTIAQSGTLNPTAQQVAGVYYAAKGYRRTQQEIRDREAARTRPPAPARTEEPTKEPELPEDEARVARRMFRDSPDPIKEYRNYVKRIENADTTMKIPLGGGKKR